MHADYRHMPAAGLQQILGGALGPLHVLRGDVIDGIGEDALTDQHQRIVHVQLVDVILPKLQW